MAKRQQKEKLILAEGKTLRVGIVKSCFNSDITNEQLRAAQELLDDHHIEYDVIEVAGCYEIAYALQQQAQSKKYDALVALGCLIKGGTIHFEVIAGAIAQAIMDLVIKHNVPIGFGVITANTHEQAVERTWIGYDATYAALDLLTRCNPMSVSSAEKS